MLQNGIFRNILLFLLKRRKNNDYTDYNQITPIKNIAKLMRLEICVIF